MTKSVRIENSNNCPECGGVITSSQFRAEETCSQCGLVKNERIHNTSDNGKKDRFENKRIAPPLKLRGKNANQIRVFKTNSWTSPFQINLNKAYSTINRICGNLKLSKSIRIASKDLYRKALKKNLIRGHSINGILCACIFYSCKGYHYRSLKEISKLVDKPIKTPKDLKKHIYDCYTLIVKELNLKYKSQSLYSLVPRYVTDAGLDENMIILTTKFLQHCNAEINFIGKDIEGVIAAAIFMTAKKNGFHISQVRIGKVVGVTDVTIRSRCKELESLV